MLEYHIYNEVLEDSLNHEFHNCYRQLHFATICTKYYMVYCIKCDTLSCNRNLSEALSVKVVSAEQNICRNHCLICSLYKQH